MTHSNGYGNAAHPAGSTSPRIHTQPLITGPAGPCGCGCALTPTTSVGFDVDEFATDVLEQPLDPWQRWAAIHTGELLPDGRPRFRRVLLLVARQNGKTHLLKTLALFWLFVDRWKMILGTSTNLDYARESWELAVETAQNNPALSELISRRGTIRLSNGEQRIRTDEGCRYKVGTATRTGGRSLSINRLICDEFREHQDWSAYSASYNAMNAQPEAQAWFITNMGDQKSIPLNSLRKSAIQYLENSAGDYRLGIFEWSAPAGCALTDVSAIASANPNVGRRLDWDTILGAAATAATDPAQEAEYRTEVLCQQVQQLDPAIDIQTWAQLGPPTLPAAPLDELRDRTALGWDVSPDGLRATIYAAALTDDGQVIIDGVASYVGTDATAQLRAGLPQLAKIIRPRVIGWLPSGPGAAVAAELADNKNRRGTWPPPGIRIEAVKADTPAVCMGLAELVRTRQLRHNGDPLLTAQVATAAKTRAPAWVFTRGTDTTAYVETLYAAAVAAHLARTLRPALQVQEVIAVPRAQTPR